MGYFLIFDIVNYYRPSPSPLFQNFVELPRLHCMPYAVHTNDNQYLFADVFAEKTLNPK